MRRTGRVLREERGQALAEFALAVPVLLMFVFGAIQFGLLMRAQLTVQTAAVEGARVLARETAAPAEAEARARAVLDAGLGGYAGGAEVRASRGGETVTVRVRSGYPLIIPFVPSRYATLEATAEMRREGFRPGP